MYWICAIITTFVINPLKGVLSFIMSLFKVNYIRMAKNAFRAIKNDKEVREVMTGIRITFCVYAVPFYTPIKILQMIKNQADPDEPTTIVGKIIAYGMIVVLPVSFLIYYKTMVNTSIIVVYLSASLTANILPIAMILFGYGMLEVFVWISKVVKKNYDACKNK